jgi:hypothetical protein
MRGYFILFLLAFNSGTLQAQSGDIGKSQANPVPTSSSESGALPKAAGDQAHPSASLDSAVRPEDAVITLRGVCADTNREKDESCKTVISRHDFEFLATSINLGGKPITMAARQNLAKAYAEYLAYEPAAKKAGLEDSQQYAEIMRWVRLRMLTDLVRDQIVQQYRSPSDAEVANYYQENVAEFERVHVARIMVPRNASLPGDEKLEKADRDKKLLAVATDAHQRAVKGDAPEQIQKDLYGTLGTGAVPPTDLGKQGRKNFLAEESTEIFSLKPGEVSKVETEPASFVIYKVISKETLSESKAKDQISREISRRNIEKANQSITQSAQPEYNEKYFGPPVPDVPAPGTPAHP